ncbi:hypothetical protein AAHH67_28495 [Niallia circulans]
MKGVFQNIMEVVVDYENYTNKSYLTRKKSPSVPLLMLMIFLYCSKWNGQELCRTKKTVLVCQYDGMAGE